MPITSNSPYAEIVSFDNCRFKSLSKDDVEKVRQAFKTFDSNNDGAIGALELARVYETLGDTKTTTQIRQLMAEVDEDGDGQIQFYEFLALYLGQPLRKNLETTNSSSSLNVNGRVREGLVNRNAFFEAAVAAQDDKLDEKKAVIKAAYEQRKVERQIKQEAEEQERVQREKSEQQKREARQRLAARAALFESAQ